MCAARKAAPHCVAPLVSRRVAGSHWVGGRRAAVGLAAARLDRAAQRRSGLGLAAPYGAPRKAWYQPGGERRAVWGARGVLWSRRMRPELVLSFSVWRAP